MEHTIAGIPRALLTWLGTCPALTGLPLVYGHLPPRAGLMLAPEPGAGRTRSFIDGGWEGVYPCRLVLRDPAAGEADRLRGDEITAEAAVWAEANWQSLSLGQGCRVLGVQASGGGADAGENGARDSTVHLILRYEVM